MEPLIDPANFGPEEQIRYARHAVLPGFGMAAQKRLKNSSVLVVGAGGLGAPLLLYLCAAGVGRIGIVDPDRVSLSNLQRQVLFDTADQNLLKVEAARNRLSRLNPHVQFDLYPVALDNKNALDILHGYDLVADGSDNFPTRYLVNDACVLLGKPLVYGAIFRYEGQVAVFNLPGPDGKRGPNYRNLYPVPPQAGSIPSCAEGGVLGVLPGIIGSMQANEVIKILSGVGTPLSGKLFLFDAAAFQSSILRIPDQEPFPVTHLEDHDLLCGVPEAPVPEINVQQWYAWKSEGAAVQLIDVREPWEYAEFHIGGRLIPLDSIAQEASTIPKDPITVCICQSGIRSARAVKILQEQGGFTQVFNLKGGLEAWLSAQEGGLLAGE